MRTLAESIGERLGCGAYLVELRRTGTGGFLVEDAATPEALAGMGSEQARARLLPLEVLVASLPRLELPEREAWAIRNGQEIEPGAAPGDGEVALFGPEGEFIGVGRWLDGRVSAARLLATGEAG